MGKETGILFAPDNIRAIRDGRKTQTRRVVKEKHIPFVTDLIRNLFDGKWNQRPLPYGARGDWLYVKEGVIISADSGRLLNYYMDEPRRPQPWEKRLTAMFMAKRYARTWLEITQVRVERLQDISEADALSEGAMEWWNTLPRAKQEAIYCGGAGPCAAYQMLWDSINRKKHPWSSNPWVWVITFKKSEA